ncbi:hypothetical protein Lesp01_41170 [Lentzea sp. NBRC 102530]|nr:hypothetical protein Lesp01_41170 [Lentzea sp. NBRC 102530]
MKAPIEVPLTFGVRAVRTGLVIAVTVFVLAAAGLALAALTLAGVERPPEQRPTVIRTDDMKTR